MRVHPIAYAEVLSQLIIKVAVKTKGGFGVDGGEGGCYTLNQKK